jgi:hypothetical protein
MFLHADIADNALCLWSLQQLSQHLPRVKKSVTLLEMITTTISTEKIKAKKVMSHVP